MSGRTILFLAFFAGLSAGEIVVWRQVSVMGGASLPDQALQSHFALAFGSAVAGCLWLRRGTVSARITVAIFFLIMAAVLPVAGVLGACACAWAFSGRPQGCEGMEDRLVFGNPEALAARRESLAPKPELRPLAESMRHLGAGKQEELIHGLKHLQPPELVAHFLRRFQTDPHTSLQFAAQGVLSGAFERLEGQLRELTQRLALRSGDADLHFSAAEVLLELDRWTSEGDATADVYRQDALSHLRVAAFLQPGSARLALLEAEAFLSSRQPEAARSAARRLGDVADESRLICLQADFCEGNWAALPVAAREITNAPAQFQEALAFWAAPAS